MNPASTANQVDCHDEAIPDPSCVRGHEAQPRRIKFIIAGKYCRKSECGRYTISRSTVADGVNRYLAHRIDVIPNQIIGEGCDSYEEAIALCEQHAAEQPVQP